MMRKEFLLPGLAVGAGALGAVVRLWTLRAAFEPDTGLAVSTHPAMLLLIALTAAIVVLLALLCRSLPSALRDTDYHTAFYAPESFHLALGQASAIVIGLSSVLTLTQVYPIYLTRLAELELSAHSKNASLQALLFAAPELVQGLLGLFGAACLFLVARGLAAERSKLSFGLSTLVPAFYACVWLINTYRAQAADPVVLGFFWHLFAVICVVLAMYYAAGFSYRNVRPRLTLYFSLLGVFFCLTTLPDPHSLADLLSLAAFLLWLLAAAAALLRNLLGLSHTAAPRPAKPARAPVEEDEDDDVDIVL